MIIGVNGWDLIHSSIDSSVFYMLDGSQAITAPFAGGGQQIKNIANGTDDQDAATLGQLNSHTTNVNNPHQVTAAQVNAVSKSGDTMTGILKINTLPVIRLGEDASPENLYPALTGHLNTQKFKVEGYRDGAYVRNVLDLDLTGPTIQTDTTDLKFDGHKVWHAGNIDPVSKTGDTMTGSLIIETPGPRVELRETDSSSGNRFAFLMYQGSLEIHKLEADGTYITSPFYVDGTTDEVIPRLKGMPYGWVIDDHVIWHEGNDGAGSGLEPDLATSTRIGGIKTRYDANTNTLYIRDDGQDA